MIPIQGGLQWENRQIHIYMAQDLVYFFRGKLTKEINKMGWGGQQVDRGGPMIASGFCIFLPMIEREKARGSNWERIK